MWPTVWLLILAKRPNLFQPTSYIILTSVATMAAHMLQFLGMWFRKFESLGHGWQRPVHHIFLFPVHVSKQLKLPSISQSIRLSVTNSSKILTIQQGITLGVRTVGKLVDKNMDFLGQSAQAMHWYFKGVFSVLWSDLSFVLDLSHASSLWS